MCRILGDARGTGAHSARQGHCLSIIDRPVACDTSTPNIRWERYGHCPQPSRDVQLYKRPGFGSLWEVEAVHRSGRPGGVGCRAVGGTSSSRRLGLRRCGRAPAKNIVMCRVVGSAGTAPSWLGSSPAPAGRGEAPDSQSPHHPQQRPCRLRAGSVTSRCFPGHLSGQRTLKVSLTNDSPARLTRRPPLVSVA